MHKRQHAVNMKTKGSSRTPAGDAFSVFVVRVFQLNGLLVNAGDALAKPNGETSARWQVLATIEDSPKTVAQVARLLSLARQSVQRMADLLESDGLTTYQENPAHLRAKLLRLTPRGHSVLESIQKAQRPWADSLGAAIGETPLKRASKVLEKVIQLCT
jgi:DNA-binding MarR family transcriptional regulator